MSSLFRIEVLEAQTDHGFGETLRIKPVRFAVYTIGAVAVVAILAIYLSLSTYTRKHTVQGLLQPSGGDVTIASSRQGVVADIFVTEGQEVKEGQELLEIRRGEWLQGGSEAYLSHYKELQKQKQWLNDRLENSSTIFAMERTNLELERDTVLASIDLLREQIEIQNQQIKNLEKTLKSKGTLQTSGLVSEEEYIAQENQYLTTVERRNNLKYELKSKRIEHKSLKNRIANIGLTQDEKLIALKERLSTKEQEIIDSQVQQRSILRSPINGRVVALYVRRGDRANPGATLVLIADSDYKFVGDLYVPSRSIGFVQPGLNVLVKYDAFPYQKFGLYRGTVSSVSETIYSPEDLQRRLEIPVQTREPTYRVRIELDKQYVLNGEAQVPLQNGMSMIADIEYDRRSLIEWLFSPLLSIKGVPIK